MKKTIVVSNIPNHVREYLLKKGYHLVGDSYDGYVDAVLYNSDSGSLSYLNIFDNVIDMNNGAFVVDIKNKTLDQIESIIENRSYTSMY